MLPQPVYEFKLVLVGESSVGKSSILTRFVDDHFEESLLSTIGVDFKFRKLKVDNQEVKLQIWDTAGQETFRSIVSAYYNSSDAIIIVYDITSYKSLEEVKEYWLFEAFNNNKNDATVFLIGNKLDEASKREVESFSIESVMENPNICKHFEMSAKTGENIENVFVDICKILMSKKKEKKSVSSQPKPINPHLQNQQTRKEGSGEYKPKKCCG